MSFTSIPFYLFAALTLLLHYVLPRRFQWIVLLVMSFVFYASWGLELIPFVLVATLMAWLCARKMEAIYASSDARIKVAKDAGENPPMRVWKEEAKKQCRRWLWLALAVLIAALAFVKLQKQMANIPVLSWIPWFFSKAYHHFGKLLLKLPGSQLFLIDTVFSDHAAMASTVSILVPLGISYYTFSLISYVADVYWRKDKAEQRYFRLLAFTLYFPKILQGPISRHKDLAPQLFEGHAFDYTKFCFGLQRMVWGYFKKMVIADRLAVFVNTVFGNIVGETGAHLLVASLFGALQLYCDFSGCMDIACGFSECLGLTLAENFNHPFFSKTAAEFWRRWHITLGTWFKDYVFMPMLISPRLLSLSKKVRNIAGERAGKAVMKIVPLLAVWLLTAAWHGVGVNYLAWGAYWFVILMTASVFENELHSLTKLLRIDTGTDDWHLFQMLRTFCIYMIGHLFTRLDSVSAVWRTLKTILTDFHLEGFFDGSLYSLGLDRANFLLALAMIVVLWAVAMLEKKGSLRKQIAKFGLVTRWLIYYAAIFSIIVFGIYGPGYNASSFIYMRY